MLLVVFGATRSINSGRSATALPGSTAASLSILTVLISIVVSIIVVWKSDNAFRKAVDYTRPKLPEPIQSCIEFGIVGGLLFAGVMVAGILISGTPGLLVGTSIVSFHPWGGTSRFVLSADYRLGSGESAGKATDRREK